MEMNIAQVTVIVPVYNAAKYLADCIESVLQQEFKEFELLLVNDGSTDNSLEICEAYLQRDPRVRVLSQKNSGPGAARNKGILETRTPWLCFLDSDDLIGPKYIREFFAQGTPEQDTLVVQGMSIVTDLERKPLSTVAYPDKLITSDELDTLIPRYQILHSGYPFLKLYNTELIRSHSLQFDTSISFHEDHLFVLTYMLYVKQILLSSSTQYSYIQHLGSLSKSLHPYQESEQSLARLRTAFEKAVDHFNIKDTRYQQDINGFLRGTLLRTIEYAYRGRTSGLEQKALLERLSTYRKDISSASSNPASPRREETLCWIYLYLPLQLQHLLFNAYYSLLKGYHHLRRK